MTLGSLVSISGRGSDRHFHSLPAISTQLNDPNAFPEALLQDLIDRSPDILPVREYLPSSRALFSLGREVPVDIGGRTGYIDNLLVTNDGYLVIVETKLHRNPEATREVVAQTLQYGMAVARISLLELEDRLWGSQCTELRDRESIGEGVARLASDKGLSALLTEGFEEAVERHLRRGEMLLLVVSDGIHIGVERMTQWLNRQGNSSPFKFGLVELKFYDIGDRWLAVPRTVLRTREISRHVVVVDIRASAEVAASATVMDEYRNSGGGKMMEPRPVGATIPLTPRQLLQLIAPDDLQAASQLIDLLMSQGFDQGGTAFWVHYGVTYPAEGREFHPLVYLGKKGVAAYPLMKVQQLLGVDQVATFHRQVNAFGQFFREEQIDQPASQGCLVKYWQLQPLASAFVAFLAEFRDKVLAAFDASEPT